MRKPPGVAPAPETITREDPGGDAAVPEVAALERLSQTAWRGRADRTGSVQVPLPDGDTWRRVKFWTVSTFAGFRYGDDHHAVAAVFRRRAPPKATGETCLHDFESWAGAFVQGMGVAVTPPVDSKRAWRNDRVVVRTREGTVLWGMSKRSYAGVYGSYVPWDGVCLTLAYAFPMQEDASLARRVRDRFAEDAFSQFFATSTPPVVSGE